VSKTDDKNTELWLSSLEYIRQMEKLWEATIVVEITTDGANYAQTCFVRVKASVPSLEVAGRCYKVEEYERWPRNDFKTIPGLVWWLLNRIDHRIGAELHKQQELPF